MHPVTKLSSQVLTTLALGLYMAIAGTGEAQTSRSDKDSSAESRKSKPVSKPATSAKSVGREGDLSDTLVNPQSFNDRALSKMVFDLTNRERKNAGLPILAENSYLANSATAHSRDMASRGYFNHKSKGLLNRTDPRDRAQAVGYSPSRIAENIAMIPTYNSTRTQTVPGRGQVVEADYNSYRRLAEYSMQEWMKSPGHRKNILDGSLNSLGVGTAIGVQNNVPYVYLTQNFGG